MILSSKMSAELKWPDERRLVKPDGATSPVWEHFRAELLVEPRLLSNGKQDKYGEIVYCMLCKKRRQNGHGHVRGKFFGERLPDRLTS